MDTSHHQISKPTHEQDHRLQSQDLHRHANAKSLYNSIQPNDPQPDILSEKLNVSVSDFILPVTFLGITLLGILFVFGVLIVWLKNYITSEKNGAFGCKSQLPNHDIVKIMERYDTDDAGRSFKIKIDSDDSEESTKKRKDDFEFNLPISNYDVKESKSTEAIRYIDDNQRNLSIVSIKNYGGSSPKLPENDHSIKEVDEDTDASGPKFLFPSESNPGCSNSAQPSNSKTNVIESKCGKFKIAIPEQQWIFHQKTPLEYKGFSINLPKPFPLAEAVKIELGTELSSNHPKTFSVTRSPSLEKDDRSPFVYSAKTEKSHAFKFPIKKSDSKLSTESIAEPTAKVSRNSSDENVFMESDSVFVAKSHVKPGKKVSSSHDNFNVHDKLLNFADDVHKTHRECSLNGRRCDSVNSFLCICAVSDVNTNRSFQSEKLEMQNSLKNVHCASAKELKTYTKFNFSPKQLCSSACETNASRLHNVEVQHFFPSDRQLPSPKPLTESPFLCPSPKVFSKNGENQNRNNSSKPHLHCGSDIVLSPRSHSAGARKPRSNKENYFIFDKVYSADMRAPIPTDEVDSSNLNNSKTKEYMCNNTNRLEQPKLFKQNSFDISRSNDRNFVHHKQSSLDNTILCENNNSSPDITIRTCLSDNLKRSDDSDLLKNGKQTLVFSNEDTHIKPIYKTDNNNTNRTINILNYDGELKLEEIVPNKTFDEKYSTCDAKKHDNVLIAPNAVEIRRQRLKSISLDSDNAKIIEQNLGLPIVKHLKHEDLTIPVSSCFIIKKPELSCGSITPSIVINKETKFSFDHAHDGPELESIHYPISDETMQFSPNVLSPKRRLMDSSNTKSFTEMQPRFSPKEFEMIITEDTSITAEHDKKLKSNKNLKNLTIDLSKKDSDLEKELLEFERLYSEAEKRLTPKTPTLKVKATSLDSSDSLNLSLPQKKGLDVPQNSISVPNTPKRQFKRIIGQKILKKSGHAQYNTKLNEISAGTKITQSSEIRKPFAKSQTLIDSGIYLRENHANLMLYQGPKYSSGRVVCPGNRWMGSFDENMVDMAENAPEICISNDQVEQDVGVKQKSDISLLGSNLSLFKQNLSVSSTNLKTLPEGVPSNDFEPTSDEKVGKKSILQRRGSNQSLTITLDATQSALKYSTLSLQGSNCSLSGFGTSSHNLASLRNSASNFSLNTDNRQKKNILERRNSNTSLTLNLDASNLHSNHSQKVTASASFNMPPDIHEKPSENAGKKGLLQRRGSNNSLTLNIKGSTTNLNRFSSNSSLNINQDTKLTQRKSLLERRSSNTSLALNMCSSTQLSTKRGLSVSNYNLNSSSSNLSHYASNQSIPNTRTEQKKGLLERRSSNTSLTLNIHGSNTNVQSHDAPREIEIEDGIINTNVKCNYEKTAETNRIAFAAHRKSLSTENLLPKSYKVRLQQFQNSENVYFGSHDNLWSHSYVSGIEDAIIQDLTYVGGDQDNEMIYAFGDRQNTHGFIRNITTKPLSPQSTSEDFKIYLANIQHLQSASNMLGREQLKDLNAIFNILYNPVGISKPRKESSSSMDAIDKIDLVLHELSLKHSDGWNKQDGSRPLESSVPSTSLCSEYQKSLLRKLHQEFWDLPTNFQEKPIVFGSHTKNRYKTILPNEHSRFILKPEFGNGPEGYINANFIKGHEYSKNCYIATQGPLLNTIYDFWLMVYQNSCQFKQTCMKTNEDRHFGVPLLDNHMHRSFRNNLIQKIVMLTDFTENSRQKCEKYFPIEQGEEMEFAAPKDRCGSLHLCDNPFADSPKTESPPASVFSSFRVRNVQIVKKTGYQIRKLIVECVNNARGANESSDVKESHIVNIFSETSGESLLRLDSLIVHHYWFDTWADHKCPKDVSALLNLSLDVLNHYRVDFESDHSDVSIIECSKSCDLASVVPQAVKSLGLIPDMTSVLHSVDNEEQKETPLVSRKHTPLELTEQPPTIVHCSAGIGRTGCLIAILNGIKQLKYDDKVDILGIVCNMRLNRGGMVQNSEQYELIHKVLCLYEDVCLPTKLNS